MFGDGALTISEFAMSESLPLATIHDAVLDFLRHRTDVVLFGAQAVNAYVDEPRMTQDVDVMSTDAGAFAEEMRTHLADRFHIAVRVRQVAAGQGFRIFQLRSPKNRHLVDVRQVAQLPHSQIIADVQIIAPLDLIVHKVLAFAARRGQPKSGTDWRDIMTLLLAFPQYKIADGEVKNALHAFDATPSALFCWSELANADLSGSDDEGY